MPRTDAKPDGGPAPQAQPALLAAIDSAARVGICTVDRDGVLSHVNETFCRMFGWQREELIGRTDPFPFWAAEHADAASQALLDALAGRGPPGGERLVFRHRDGTLIPVLVLPAPLPEAARGGVMTFVLDMREQAAIEDGLQRELERFRALPEGIEEVFYIIEPPNRLVYVSPAYRKVAGRDPEAVLRDPPSYLEAIAPEHRAAMRAAHASQLQGRATRLQYRIIRADGSDAWIWDQAFPILDAEGQVLRVVGMASDITPRRATESKLLRREAMLSRAEEVAGFASWEVEVGASQTTRWSDQMYALLGYPRGSVTPGTAALLERVHPLDRERVAAFASGRDAATRTEYRLLMPDGTIRYVRAWQERQGTAGADRLLAWGALQDVTQRELDARELERSRQLLQEAQRTSGFVSFQIRLRSGTVEADPEFLRLLGLAPGESPRLVKDWLRNVHPAEREACAERLRRALKPEARAQRLEFRVVTPAGNERHLVAYLRPMPDGRDGWPTVIGTLQDDTEEYLATRRLLQVQRLEALGQLTGGVAHDFNNLLQAVIGNLDELAAALPADSPLRERAEAATAAALRGADLTRLLLAIAGQRPMQMATIDIGERLRQLRPLLETSAGGRVRLRLELPAEPLRVQTDPARFDSAVINLVVNARDAMPDGGEIAIELGSRDGGSSGSELPEGLANGRYARVRVLDSGPGIPPAIAERAFDPFFTTKAAGHGTGLGLAMVYGFAQQLGGTATIARRAEGGTCACIYLPLLEPAPDEPTSPERAPTPPPAGEGSAARPPPEEGGAAPRRVLLVDDQPDLLHAVSAGLRRLGWEVGTATSTEEALEQLRRAPFDLVLTDVVMPGERDGVALARQVAAEHPGIAMVLASGYADMERLKALPWPLVQKPFRTLELDAVLRAALQSRATSR